MILENYLKVVPSGANISYYKNLGYEIKKHCPIDIKYEDVQKGSGVEEKLRCDICGEIYERKHYEAIRYREKYDEKDICLSCIKKINIEKSKNAVKDKYGVDFPLQSKEIKDKTIQTTLKKYGVKYTLSNKEIRNKAHEIFLNRMKEDEDGTFIKESNEKRKETCLKKYGAEFAAKSPLVREKITKTLKNNGAIPTSKQQIEVFNLLKQHFLNNVVELNYPVSSLFLDILFITKNGIKIDIEYDGWYWHQDETKDRKRDEVIKKYGYKILRIKSGTKIPSIDQIKNSINYLMEKGNNYSHIILEDWKEPTDK